MVFTEITAPEVRPYSAGALVVRARNESTPSGEGRVTGGPVEAMIVETPFSRTSVLSVRLPLIESCEVLGVLPAPPHAAPGTNANRLSVSRLCDGNSGTSLGGV